MKETISGKAWRRVLDGQRATLLAESVGYTHALVRVGDETRVLSWQEWASLPVWDEAAHPGA